MNAETFMLPWANTSWGRSFLHPEDAYKKAGAEAQQGYEEGRGYEQPYNEFGQKQMPGLQSAEDQLLNPEELQKKWAAGYETSPYAKQSMEVAKNSGLDAASSMGLMGSSAALGNIQTGASDIMNKDRQQYMNDLMEKYKTGIGLGTNIYGTGAQTGQHMSNQAMQAGENRGAATYGANTAPGEQFKSMLNMAMKAAMGGFGPGSQ